MIGGQFSSFQDVQKDSLSRTSNQLVSSNLFNTSQQPISKLFHSNETFVEVTGTFVSFQDLKSLQSNSSTIPSHQLFQTNGQS
mgnify:CR=1 FL=1